MKPAPKFASYAAETNPVITTTRFLKILIISKGWLKSNYGSFRSAFFHNFFKLVDEGLVGFL